MNASYDRTFCFVVLARIGPLDGPSPASSQGSPAKTASLETQQVVIWPSSPELVAVDDQAGITVLLQGEVYTPPSSPEDVLKAYLSEGESLFGSLNGSFAVLVVDQRKNRVLVAADRFSSRKVFFSGERGEWWLSSTLHRHPTAGHALSSAGVGSLLSSGVAHIDLTPFEGVRKLRPASLYTFSGDSESVCPYWSFHDERDLMGQDPIDLRNQLIEVMRSGVVRRLRGAADVFLSLSGGYDSRAVGGFLGEVVGDQSRIRSFTYHHGPSIGDTDAGTAAAVASHLGFRHEIIEAFQGDLVGTVAANAAAGQGISNFCAEVDAWSAIGPRTAASDHNVLYVAEIPGMAVSPRGGTPESVLASVDVYPISTIGYFVEQLDPEVGASLLDGWGGYYAQLLHQAGSHQDPRIGHDHLYLQQRLSNTLMLWRECFQMPYVRVANPFLDNDVVDVMLGLPVEFRSQKLLYREALSETFPDLFSIPVSPGGWGAPDWAKEIRSNVGQIRELLRSPSRLDELIPSSAIIRLLESGLAVPAAKRDDVVVGLKALVRNSAPLRRVVRNLKPRVQPAVRRRRSWERLMLDLLSLRGFLQTDG